ncbi:MAG TPA: hypothetical protein PLF22_00220 [Pseudomonadales bacterium]|nr:hypothetical protein [Pseudomonadales bacterium]
MNGILAKKPYWILPVFVALAIYFPVINHGFVWDDHQFFEGNGFFAKANIVELFFSKIPLWENIFFYRPLTQIFFFVQFIIGKGDPSVFHVVSLLVFLANAMLVMAIVARAKQARVNAPSGEFYWIYVLLAGVLYVVHPAMAEVVGWISSQFDLQMTFWILLIIFVSMIEKHYLLSGLCSMVLYFFACSSKEMSALFPIVFIIFHYFVRCVFGAENTNMPRLIREKTPELLGFFLGGCIYLVLRTTCVGVGSVKISHGDFVDYFFDVMRALFWYTKLSILPFYGMGMHFKAVGQYNDQLYAIGGGAIFIGTLVALRCYKPLGLMGISFIISLAPALLTVNAGYSVTFVSDRYLSYPLSLLIIQACIWMGSLSQQINMTRFFSRFLVVVSLILLVEMAIYSSQLSRIWKSDLAIWRHTLEVSPDVSYARSQVVAAYVEMGNCEKAEEVAGKSKTSTVTAMIAIARCNLEKNPQFALQQMEDLLAANGAIGEHDFYNVLTTLAIANSNLGHYEKAIEIYRDVLAAYPSQYKTHWSLALTYLHACRESEARSEFESGLSFVPQAARAEWVQLYAKSSGDLAAACSKKAEAKD